MPIDIKLGPNQDIVLSEGNDLATVDGTDTIHQSTGIDASNVAEDFIGEQNVGWRQNQIRGKIRTALLKDPEVDQVIDVRIEGTTDDSVSFYAYVTPDLTLYFELRRDYRNSTVEEV